jgi:3-hydroxyisobutyrate dehydrogenase-like beta-hydroxyacid dehydrogenase
MEIAIIGSGNVGRVLASAAVPGGHEVVLTAAHPERARAAAQEVGARAADSNRAAVEWSWQNAWKLLGPTGA